MTHPIIIIGGGLGGLSAAIHLAAAGRRVVLFEKNERVGGKLNLLEGGGYTFDTGPSLVTMPWVLRSVIETAGARLEDELHLIQLDRSCRYHWADGEHFDAWQNMPLLIQEINRLNPDDVGGYLRFMEYAARIYNATAGPFLLRPFDGIRDLINPAFVSDSLTIDPLRTMDQAVRTFFRSPQLRQVFNRYATYNGSSPYRTPATFNLIAFVEFMGGAWYIKGGLYEIARALLKLARRLGVEVHVNTPVERVLTRNGAAHAVQLASGEVIEAEAVIVNADPRYAYGRLIEGFPGAERRMAQLEPSCSGFVLLLGIDTVYPDLAHHNIFFSNDYANEFRAIFDRGVPAPDPTIYINVTSGSDPDHAPPGHMNLFMLINAPALNGRVNWAREAGPYRDLILRKLERMGLEGISTRVRFEHRMTPADLQERYNAQGGAIYGLSSNKMFNAFLRPPLRARELRRLYFVGGGTHPGGGIPLVLLSGKAVAERVQIDR